MTVRTRQLLEQAEALDLGVWKNVEQFVDPSGIVTLINLDGRAIVRRIENLAPEVAQLLELELGGADSSIQDAYYIMDMWFGQEGEVQFRFSAYGALFTVILNYIQPNPAVPVKIGDPATIDKRVSEAIEFVESRGHVYVSENDLAESYTGNDPKFRNKTWWDRYFDWM